MVDSEFAHNAPQPIVPQVSFGDLHQYLVARGLNYGDLSGSLGDRERFGPTFVDYIYDRTADSDASRALQRERVAANLTSLHNLIINPDRPQMATYKSVKNRFIATAAREGGEFPQVATAQKLQELLHEAEGNTLANEVMSALGMAIAKHLGETATAKVAEPPIAKLHPQRDGTISRTHERAS